MPVLIAFALLSSWNWSLLPWKDFPLAIAGVANAVLAITSAVAIPVNRVFTIRSDMVLLLVIETTGTVFDVDERRLYALVAYSEYSRSTAT